MNLKQIKLTIKNRIDELVTSTNGNVPFEHEVKLKNYIKDMSKELYKLEPSTPATMHYCKILKYYEDESKKCVVK